MVRAIKVKIFLKCWLTSSSGILLGRLQHELILFPVFSGVKNKGKLDVADLKSTGHKAFRCDFICSVCECKVYCNDDFSGVHVRSAVGDTAGAPKENSGSGFQRD